MVFFIGIGKVTAIPGKGGQKRGQVSKFPILNVNKYRKISLTPKSAIEGD
jgi:hypothetical protein